MARRPSKRDLSTGILVVLLAGVLVSQALQASADHQPADKVVATGSTVAKMQSGPTGSETIKVLEATIKTSSPTDLLLQANAECSLFTTTGNTGDEVSDVRAGVDFFATIDYTGATPPTSGVPVSAQLVGSDNGVVTFCDRAQKLTTANMGSDDFIQLHQETKSTHGFDWVAFNLGNGPHTVALWATLRSTVATSSTPDVAQAGIGKRIMIIEAVKFPHHVDEVSASGS